MRIKLLCLCAVMTLLSCSPKGERNNYAAFTASLDSLFSLKFPAGEPGACVVVTLHDSIIYDRGFGMATLPGHVVEQGEPITDETMFNICSVSKQFSAVALLKLEEQGLISLQDPVSKYFPEFKADFFKEITLAQLLSHTSGLPDSRPRTPEEWAVYTSKNKTEFSRVEDFKRFCGVEESVRFLEKQDSLAFEPGTQYEYQNPTFQLVELLVERVTDQDFDAWMQEHVFLPAGMTSTLYYEPEKEIPNLAHGYEPVGFTTLNGDRVPLDNPFGYWRSQDGKWQENDYGEASFFGTKADGGIYTTPLDFVKWDRALYHDKVMNALSREKAHTSRILTDIPETSYGYGFFVEERKDRPKKIYHTGDNGGFLIFEGRFPDLDVFYLIFANRPDWEREATVEKVDNIILNKLTR